MSNLSPASKPNEPVICVGCDHEFKQDPPFEVECPVCKAKPGTYCKRPSGHTGPFVNFHAERDVLALKMGFYDHPDMKTRCGPHSGSQKAKDIIERFLEGKKTPVVPPLSNGGHSKVDSKQMDLF